MSRAVSGIASFSFGRVQLLKEKLPEPILDFWVREIGYALRCDKRLAINSPKKYTLKDV
jgi:hypothetical protein